MIDRIKALIRKSAGFIRSPRGETIRYIIIGGCTTVVDYASFFLMDRVMHLDFTFSNIASTSLAIIFAYLTNKLYVFESCTDSIPEFFAEFIKFICSRLFTMAIEIGCVHLFVIIMRQNSLLGKAEAIVIVVIINYILSKFLVFRKKRDRQ